MVLREGEPTRRGARACRISLKVLGGAGIIRPYSPLGWPGWPRPSRQWGPGPAGGFRSLAVRAPDQVGLVDELGELTFGEMHARSNALARGLRELGVERGRRRRA